MELCDANLNYAVGRERPCQVHDGSVETEDAHPVAQQAMVYRVEGTCEIEINIRFLQKY